MKIPIKWLAEYVELKGLSDAEISNALTMSGTENEIVKGVEFPNIIVGEILEIADHPDADRLHVTKTNVGKESGGLLQIVCGAPNIEVGQKVPVALVGAMIGEFEIKKAKIRGVESNGMLCSESELGISDNHDGILILDPRAKVGVPLSKALNIGGTVLEAEITPNRSDCFSMIGVAGEAAASLKRKLKGRNFKKAEVGSSKKVEVKVEEKKICPRYIAKVVEGIEIEPSPGWMQERLESCGVRPINNIVDVTNYVMLEWGQPMHAFDLAKISGGIKVRRAKKGEKLKTLDGIERNLTDKDLVIADSKKAIALAGVMGGANSEVDTKTKSIVLEAAVFEGTNVRKTAQRLALRTEASNRFEKGVPLGLPELAIERAAGLLKEISDKVSEIMVGENSDVLSAWIWTRRVGLPLHRVKDFLGVEIEKEKVMEILTSLGFEVEEFDFKKEARKHVGKPYVWGASFKTHGDMAFDCSYLTDYIYSKIGKFVGHTALAQFELGTPVETAELKPGDVLFVKGHIEKSVTDHYYVPAIGGGVEKVTLEEPKEVGHCGIYIGGGRIIHSRESVWNEKTASWKKLAKGSGVEEDVTVFTQNPQYLGARRYIDESENWLSVTAPWWRLDISIEEDLLEEVGRIYGFENIPGRLPQGNLPGNEPNKMLNLADDIKEVLVGAGFSEVFNYSFLSEKDLQNVGEISKGALQISNPISPEQEFMRLSLVPSLLKNIATNQHNFDDIKIFEIASTYIPEGKEPASTRPSLGGLPTEKMQLGIAIRPNLRKPGQGYFDLKGAIELIAEKLRIGNISVENLETETANNGQAVKICTSAGEIGKIFVPNKEVRKLFGIKTECAVGVFDLLAIQKMSDKKLEYRPVSRFPQVIRDINFVFDNKKSVAEIENVLNRVDNKQIRSYQIRDIFQGGGLVHPKLGKSEGGLSENEKSVTIRLVLGADDKTLTDEEITASQNQIVSLIKKSLNGQPRLDRVQAGLVRS